MLDIRIIDVKENKVIHTNVSKEQAEKIEKILNIKEEDWVRSLYQKHLAKE